MRRLKSRKQTGHYEISLPTHHSYSDSNRALGLFTIGPSSSHPDQRAISYGHSCINTYPATANEYTYGHTAGLSDPTRACGNRHGRRDQATPGIHHLPATLL